MTAIGLSIDMNAADESAELPPPDALSTSTSATGDNTCHRPLSSVRDTGRISFGAAMRLPVKK